MFHYWLGGEYQNKLLPTLLGVLGSGIDRLVPSMCSRFCGGRGTALLFSHMVEEGEEYDLSFPTGNRRRNCIPEALCVAIFGEGERLQCRAWLLQSMLVVYEVTVASSLMLETPHFSPEISQTFLNVNYQNAARKIISRERRRIFRTTIVALYPSKITCRFLN